MPTPRYKKIKCEACGQGITYLLPLDRGSAEIMIAIGRAIRTKGINIIHPRKEIEGKLLSSNQVGNLSRPRFHGLIAKVKSAGPGNYCLTEKGGRFLRGEPVQKYAIVSKAEHHNIGYYEDETVTISKLLGSTTYWEGIDYEIKEGRIVVTPKSQVA